MSIEYEKHLGTDYIKKNQLRQYFYLNYKANVVTTKPAEGF